VLDTTHLACNDTILMTDSSMWSIYLAISPPNGWNNYYERQQRQGLAPVTPPFGATCPLTAAARRGQRLNLTVISMGQYGIHELDLGGPLLEISLFLRRKVIQCIVYLHT